MIATRQHWDTLVTVALLGTSRRELPAELIDGVPLADGSGPGGPEQGAARLLDLATVARAALLAGAPVDTGPVAPRAPTVSTAVAPRPATRLLGRLLSPAQPNRVNDWLAACVERRLTIDPDLWAPVATVAASGPAYDRSLLAAALGPAGLWFVRQNPAWRQLGEVVEATRPADQPAPPTAAALLAEAEQGGAATVLPALLAIPGPWPVPLAAAALTVVLRGPLSRPEAIGYAAEVGRRMSLEAYSLLHRLAVEHLSAGAGSPETQAFAHQVLTAAEQAAYERIEVRMAFDPQLVVPRLSLPPVGAHPER